MPGRQRVRRRRSRRGGRPTLGATMNPWPLKPGRDPQPAVDLVDDRLSVGGHVVEALDERRKGQLGEPWQEAAEAGAHVGAPARAPAPRDRRQRAGRWPAGARPRAASPRARGRPRSRAARAAVRAAALRRAGSVARERSASSTPSGATSGTCAGRRGDHDALGASRRPPTCEASTHDRRRRARARPPARCVRLAPAPRLRTRRRPHVGDRSSRPRRRTPRPRPCPRASPGTSSSISVAPRSCDGTPARCWTATLASSWASVSGRSATKR